MPTYATVPGTSATVVPSTFNTQYNLQVAEQIANVLAAAQGNNSLDVQTYTGGALPPLPAGDTGLISVGESSGSIQVQPGYTFTIIGESSQGGMALTGPFTVSGGGSLLVGDQPTTYYGAPGAGTVSIAAGGGDDLLSLPSDSSYEAALGNGDDTVNANGSGTITGGDGASLFFAGSQGGTNLINSNGTADTIVAGQGTVSVDSEGANPLIYGGPGKLVYLGGAPGNATIAGGTGTETLFGGDGQNMTYTDGANTTPGANIMAAGAGNETLNAGNAQYGVQLAIGNGSVNIIGSAASDTIYGGSGAATITTNGGSDLFVFGDIAGHTGGTDLITDFNTATDTISLTGVTLASESAAGTNPAMITLSDGTHISFTGITDPTKINITYN